MAAEPVPGTPGISEMRSETGSEFHFITGSTHGRGAPGSPCPPGIRRVSLRAEIDTSPPFGSVEEAVTRFGGRGSWIPFYKLGENYNGVEEFDLKKVEEQATELEKDLIVKELETLDVLEELATTKRIVEELKRQLQEEALKCLQVSTPDFHLEEQNSSSSSSSPAAVKEMNKENHRNVANNYHDQIMGNSSPYSNTPDLILMELKQAKSNLGKTINDLGLIQSSVECLNKKMQNEKILLEKTRERLSSQFAGVTSLEEEMKSMKVKAQHVDAAEVNNTKSRCEKSACVSREERQFKKITEAANFDASRKTAEMRWVAAKKMEEAARAAEAVALEEIKALTSYGNSSSSSGYVLPEPAEKMTSFGSQMRSPLSLKAQEAEGWFKKKLVDAMRQIDEAHTSKMMILRKMKEATEEVKHSKQFLEEAMNKVELAHRKQLAAEEALQSWGPEHAHKRQTATYSTPTNLNNFRSPDYNHKSPMNEMNKSVIASNDGPTSKPYLKSTVSMRDVLGRKQVLPQDMVANKEMDHGHETHRVALSEMIHALRDDLTFPSKAEKDGTDQKPALTHRKRFGFIQISLPLSKPSKKKMQTLNPM